jgi:hypothetical protein
VDLFACTVGAGGDAGGRVLRHRDLVGWSMRSIAELRWRFTVSVPMYS